MCVVKFFAKVIYFNRFRNQILKKRKPSISKL